MRNRRTTGLALIAAVLTVGALWWTGRPVAPQKATMDEVRAEAKAGGYRLITTEELGALYRRAPQGLLLVDTRQEWEYRTGHMEGALNFPMEPTWWARWRRAGPLASLLGSDKDRTVVFY